MGRAVNVILFGALVFALAGCGGSSSGSGAEGTTTEARVTDTSVDTTTGSKSSIEERLSAYSKLDVIDCTKDTTFDVPSATKYSCKYRDPVTGKLKGYKGLIDRQGNALAGAPQEAPTSAVAVDNANAALGDVVESVTAAVNDVMSKRTEEEFGSPSLGSEVRNCRKVRELSENSLVAPGGAGYLCEVWSEEKMLSDSGIAVIDVHGKVATHP